MPSIAKSIGPKSPVDWAFNNQESELNMNNQVNAVVKNASDGVSLNEVDNKATIASLIEQLARVTAERDAALVKVAAFEAMEEDPPESVLLAAQAIEPTDEFPHGPVAAAVMWLGRALRHEPFEWAEEPRNSAQRAFDEATAMLFPASVDVVVGEDG